MGGWMKQAIEGYCFVFWEVVMGVLHECLINFIDHRENNWQNNNNENTFCTQSNKTGTSDFSVLAERLISQKNAMTT